MKRYTTKVVLLAKVHEHSLVEHQVTNMTRQGWTLLSTYTYDDVVAGVFQTWEKVRR